MTDEQRRGHGHVIPNADGSKARCGGPRVCPTCAREYASLTAKERDNWQEDARRYSENADYWRTRADAAEARVAVLEEALEEVEQIARLKLAQARAALAGSKEQEPGYCPACSEGQPNLAPPWHHADCPRATITPHDKANCSHPDCQAEARAALADVRGQEVAADAMWRDYTEAFESGAMYERQRTMAGCGCVHRDHGGERCHCCGLPSHVGFSVPNDVWIAAGNYNGTLCIMCFVARAEARGVEWCQWINWWPVCELDARKGDEAARQVMQPEEGNTARPAADNIVARAALADVREEG